MIARAARLERRLHHAYYLLAAFALLTVGGALYLTHRLTDMFDASVATNKAWQARVRRYSMLDDREAEIRAPVNDLFISGDVRGESAQFEQSVQSFTLEIQAARHDATSDIDGAIGRTILADIDKIQANASAMTVGVRALFAEYRREQRADAAERLPAINKTFALLNEAINTLQDDGIATAGVALEEQERAARSLRAYEAVIAGGVALMVVAAALYGRRLSLQVRTDTEEREGYIARLREQSEALGSMEERLQLAAKATNDALWDWDFRTGTVWWNDALITLVGWDADVRSVDAWMALVHPDDRERVERSLRDCVSGAADARSDEYRVRRPSGTYAWVLDRGYLLRDISGAPRRFVRSMMDITERKESERMKSDFVSFVSHQLRTPLAGMNWMLELAADAEGLPSAARDYVSDARESAARLVSLVNDLLDIARLESGRAVAVNEAVALDDLTHDVVRELHPLVADRRHDVLVNGAQVDAVWADRQLIRQVVGNLLSNAIKYTPPGGRIEISMSQQNGAVQWGVQDNGVGVPRAAQARLFERFYRAENAMSMEVEGTGLGLHLVRLIVEQAGGRIWCESEEGRGALFAFTLPAAPQPEGVTT